MVIRVMIVCGLIVAAALPCVAEDTITAKGIVIGQGGKPLAGATVSIGHFGRGSNVVTDEKGSFSIVLPPESAGGG